MDGGPNGTQSAELARLAADATRLTEHRRSSHESRPRPTIDTKTHFPNDAATSQRPGQVALPAAVPSGYNNMKEEHISTNGTKSYASMNGHQVSNVNDRFNSHDSNHAMAATSPNLRKYAIPVSERSPMETLPAMQTSPTKPLNTPSGPQSLPSLASQLAGLREPPPPTHKMQPAHRQSFSSNSAMQSPKNEFRAPPYTTNIHTRGNGSYAPSYPSTEPSPASTNSAVSPRDYRPATSVRSMSPPSKFGPRQYQMSSNGLTTPQSDAQTPLSATSTQASTRTFSSDSSPGTDGNFDPDRTLPPLNGSSMPSGSFRCEYPGCNAAPFQTQYLLNSHANVHSQNRPHYCPVKTCSRSEGGKGFKRKNEMIRHGLVHQSPGYICPFCPEREHKYPRPDNLQRHVRVHHVDKDKDDPQLREVLSQRPEGGSRGRRRRVNS